MQITMNTNINIQANYKDLSKYFQGTAVLRGLSSFGENGDILY